VRVNAVFRSNALGAARTRMTDRHRHVAAWLVDETRAAVRCGSCCRWETEPVAVTHCTVGSTTGRRAYGPSSSTWGRIQAQRWGEPRGVSELDEPKGSCRGCARPVTRRRQEARRARGFLSSRRSSRPSATSAWRNVAHCLSGPLSGSPRRLGGGISSGEAGSAAATGAGQHQRAHQLAPTSQRQLRRARAACPAMACARGDRQGIAIPRRPLRSAPALGPLREGLRQRSQRAPAAVFAAVLRER